MRDKPFDLVIFDCDGVLVDSERICVRVEAEYLAELGAPFTEAEIIEKFVGSPAEIMRAAVGERLGRPLPVDWWKPYEQRYVDAFAAELTAVEGVAEALEELDVPFCLASNGDRAAILRNLRTTGLHGHFEGRVFSAEDVARGKPAPDLFLHAARTMGADPARCAVVEDSRYGVRAARAAGMRSFGYAGGLTPAGRLEGPGTVVFDDMRKLPALLAAG
ncbi:HAD family hydrolase [Streptomyces huiliensis]|uniref:HAD family hydrolase n=1 Tax=Streptomyces huiliensis TaxID=2876027 RepID=UPI001CBE1B08|nr:HAD family hydrolase [Streptomyces huiliensis]MBZ4321653.1 HAD family hydrolase [Streptomyces huiliensis]